MRFFLESFATAFLILFTVPTVAIVVSWNALPGEPLFTLKLGVEKATSFVVAPSYDASVKLSIKYTERRFAEAKQLLAQQHSVTGLVYLSNQVAETKKTIEKAPDAASQAQVAHAYLQTLQDVSVALEQEKRSILAEAAPVPLPLVTVTPSPTTAVSPTQAVSVTTSTPVPVSRAVVALQIAQTQQIIEETIKELEEKRKEYKELPHTRRGKNKDQMQKEEESEEDRLDGR